jgi:hypothetical protein
MIAVDERWARRWTGNGISIASSVALMMLFYIYQHIISLASDSFDLFKMLQDVVLVGGVASCFLILNKLANDKARTLCIALLMAYPLLILINVLGYVAGLSPSVEVADSGADAETLKALGIHMQRIKFPFTLGVNAFGVIGGAGVLSSMALVSLAKNRLFSIVAWLLLSISVAALLLVDSRGAMLSVLLVLICRWMFERTNSRFIWIAAFIFPIAFPLVIQQAAAILDQFGLVDLLSRQGSGVGADALTTSRSRIWDIYIDFQSHPTLLHIFGFGVDGVRSSGLYKYYLQFFPTPLAAAHALHNGILELALGFGWLPIMMYGGLIMFAGMSYRKAYLENQRKDVQWIFCLFIYIWIMNAYEETISLLRVDVLPVWLIVAGMGLAIGRQNKANLHIAGSGGIRGFISCVPQEIENGTPISSESDSNQEW